MEVSAIKKVHAIAGGLQLASQKEEYVRQTVAGLNELERLAPRMAGASRFGRGQQWLDECP